MVNINQVRVLGRITRDLELRTSSNNRKFVGFTIATDKVNGGTDYISCYAWEALAESLVNKAKKGSLIIISGHLGSRLVDNRTNLFVNVRKINYMDFGFDSDDKDYSESTFNSNNNATSNENFFSNPQEQDTKQNKKLNQNISLNKEKSEEKNDSFFAEDFEVKWE